MYEYNARVRSSEADSKGKLTIESLLDYFQDCSWFHSEDIGVGEGYLSKKKLVWVINHWQIDICRYPEVGEKIRVGTSPYDFRGFLGYRNFAMWDESGERIAVANTLWTLLSTESMKPMHAPEDMIQAYRIGEKLDMEYLPRKIRLPEKGEKLSPITITAQNLDTNGHVNNGQYVRIAMDCLKEEPEIRRLRAEYKNQAFLGEKIYPVVYRDGDKKTIDLGKEDGTSYTVVELNG